MDPFYFEPTKPIAKTPTAPTGWRYLAELCAMAIFWVNIKQQVK